MTTPRDIVLGSFIGDALALGPHWIYDPEEIRAQLGRVTTYQSPLTTYHSGKEAGDPTHYGDQARILLGSLAANRKFDLTSFAGAWKCFWESPSNISYRDGATRATLEKLHSGIAPDAAGSDSHDIAGAARIAPLFLLPWQDDAGMLEAVRAETAFTHRNPLVVEAAEFFALVVLSVQRGESIASALEKTHASREWKHLPEAWIQASSASASSESDAAILERHGLSCNIADAFPGIIHLLRRHPQDPGTALIENASAGGDSAARGMILGMVYGASFPLSDWPSEWLENLKARDEIEELIRALS